MNIQITKFRMLDSFLIKAVASILIDGQLAVHDIKIFQYSREKLVVEMLRGVLSIVLPKDTDGIAQELANHITTFQIDSRIADEVSAFAKSFVRVYLSYEERGNDNYRKSLQHYCSSTLISDICESITFQNAATATYTCLLYTSAHSSSSSGDTL